MKNKILIVITVIQIFNMQKSYSQVYGTSQHFIYINEKKLMYYERRTYAFELFGYLVKKDTNSYYLMPKYDLENLPLQYTLVNNGSKNTVIYINIIQKNRTDAEYVNFKNYGGKLIINDSLIYTPIPDSLNVNYIINSIYFINSTLKSEVLKFDKKYSIMHIQFQINDKYYKLWPSNHDNEVIMFHNGLGRKFYGKWTIEPLLSKEYYFQSDFLPYDSLSTFDVETYW